MVKMVKYYHKIKDWATSEKAKRLKVHKEFRDLNYTGRILYKYEKTMARTRICMEGLKYLRPIWQSSYTSQRIHIIMMSMVVKLIVNLKHLQKETIDIFSQTIKTI